MLLSVTLRTPLSPLCSAGRQTLGFSHNGLPMRPLAHTQQARTNQPTNQHHRKKKSDKMITNTHGKRKKTLLAQPRPQLLAPSTRRKILTSYDLKLADAPRQLLTFIKPHPHTNLHPAATNPPCAWAYFTRSSKAHASVASPALSLGTISAAMARSPTFAQNCVPRRPNPTPNPTRRPFHCPVANSARTCAAS